MLNQHDLFVEIPKHVLLFHLDGQNKFSVASVATQNHGTF